MRSDELLANFETINKAGTSRFDIERSGPARSELLLNQAGRGRKEHVGRDGRDNDEVDFLRSHTCSFQGKSGRLRRHVGGELPLASDAPLLDSGAGGNPFV